jgi:glyoxylase-like metal-dependent hydrolase (beta-lactamase superfamily II)
MFRLKESVSMKLRGVQAGWLITIAYAITSVCLATAASAGGPMQKSQAPGYYRVMLGDFEVTALSDGTLGFNVQELLTNITPAQLDADLARAFIKEPVDFSVNAFLINTGSKLVLIDTGTGGSYGPTVGKLLSNLAASGYKPEQVDEIYITHMHGDHIGGLTQNGKAVFPNATVRAAKAEGDYWLSEAKMNAAPADDKGGFQAAMAALKPYIAAKHFQPFTGDVELVPGVRAIAAPGHTPGHTVYLVSSKDQNLLVWGDLMHVAAAQFPDPAVTIQFDSDSPAAARQRQKVFAEAAAKGYLVAGAHLSFPGIGHLRANDAGAAAKESYSYVPVAYRSTP